VPEGDTIVYAAQRLRGALVARVPESVETPQPRHALDYWPRRLAGRPVTSIDTHGKHLFMHFDGDLVLHSHLGMIGMWSVYGGGRRWRRSPRRAWIVLRCGGQEVVEFDGPLLELMTAARVRFDQRLSALGPDVLAEEFDTERFLRRLRADAQDRDVGDALLDQRNIAGLGNIWKAEGCWEAGIDPCRPLSRISNDEAAGIVAAVRPRMSLSAREGPKTISHGVYGRAGRPCPRCGAPVMARPQGDANRVTYWCSGCQV
jgi:endonuclease-8